MTNPLLPLWLALTFCVTAATTECEAASQIIAGLSVTALPIAMRCRFSHFPIYRRGEPRFADCRKVQSFRITDRTGQPREGEFICADPIHNTTRQTLFHTNPNSSILFTERGIPGEGPDDVRFPSCVMHVSGRTIALH